jgi:hypothetical protein
MKSFTGDKRVMSDKVRVAIFYGENSRNLEDKVNNWLSENNYEIVSIEFDATENYLRSYILYMV